MKAVILGGKSGLGLAIAKNLTKVCKKVHKLNSKDIDTSDLSQINAFCKKYYGPDVLVLNTGGPPDKKIHEIDPKLMHQNFNKLFVSFFEILKNIGVKKKGYVFLISSFIIKEPSDELILSSSLRSGFNTLFKSLSIIYSKKQIRFINIAPGPFKTKRLVNLLKNEGLTLKKFEKTLPLKKIPDPDEIGKFVKYVVENKVISLNGSTIYFDGNLLRST